MKSTMYQRTLFVSATWRCPAWRPFLDAAVSQKRTLPWLNRAPHRRHHSRFNTAQVRPHGMQIVCTMGVLHRLTFPSALSPPPLQITAHQSWTPSSRPSASWQSTSLLNPTKLWFIFFKYTFSSFVCCSWQLGVVSWTTLIVFIGYVLCANPAGGWLLHDWNKVLPPSAPVDES